MSVVSWMLRILKATEVGGREGAKERELEWERKNDQADEDLLELTQEEITQKSRSFSQRQMKQKWKNRGQKPG